jgi:hypothetical protein
MPESGWQRRFDHPIVLPDGKSLHTLRDAADYITGLPKEQSDLAPWQIAIEALMLVARSGADNVGADDVCEGAQS